MLGWISLQIANTHRPGLVVVVVVGVGVTAERWVGPKSVPLGPGHGNVSQLDIDQCTVLLYLSAWFPCVLFSCICLHGFSVIDQCTLLLHLSAWFPCNIYLFSSFEHVSGCSRIFRFPQFSLALCGYPARRLAL